MQFLKTLFKMIEKKKPGGKAPGSMNVMVDLAWNGYHFFLEAKSCF
jgi:hypothetical protein